MLQVSAIIVASGTGSRTTLSVPKQFYKIAGKAILYYAIKPFEESPLIREIIVVTLPDWIEFCRDELSGFTKIKKIAVGGRTRQQSVFNGLDEVDAGCALVAVHDGARPFVTERDISEAIRNTEGCAVAVGVKVSDTIKSVNTAGFVDSSLKRELLWAMQTPQILPREVFTAARERAEEDGVVLTDDVALAEYIGYPVKIVEGRPENIKITYDRDLILARTILEGRVEKKYHAVSRF